MTSKHLLWYALIYLSLSVMGHCCSCLMKKKKIAGKVEQRNVKQSYLPVILPPPLWEIVFSYNNSVTVRHQAEFRFLCRAMNDALDELCMHEVDRMHGLHVGVINLFADVKPIQLKRRLLALTRAPPESIQRIYGVAGNVSKTFWRNISESLTNELFNLLTRLPALRLFEGPFLYQMTFCPRGRVFNASGTISCPTPV